MDSGVELELDGPYDDWLFVQDELERAEMERIRQMKASSTHRERGQFQRRVRDMSAPVIRKAADPEISEISRERFMQKIQQMAEFSIRES